VNVPVERVRAQILAIFAGWGMDEAPAKTAAEVMVETDLAGVDSHGVSMLMDYDQSRRNGRLNLKARPRVVREGPASALIDADAGLGHPAAVMAMELAIGKARAVQVGVVSVFNSHHFGAAGYYAALASRAGMLGMVTSATRTIGVVPTRARVPVLGTNPIAFAAPAKRNAPFLLDMATSAAAANKVKVYGLHGRQIPAGWVLDDQGRAVRDPQAALDILYRTKKGGLTPLGGTPEMSSHKGYGLALMAHILGGTLSGASFSPIRVRTQKPQDPDRLGHFFLAIDPRAFRPPGAFEDDLDALIDVMHTTPPLDPGEPVLVPGDPEAASREQRLREGIPLADTLREKIKEVCERSGAPFLL
jgi:LDH2 family malate/lactate/ureidoglycolate dehydrogenase